MSQFSSTSDVSGVSSQCTHKWIYGRTNVPGYSRPILSFRTLEKQINANRNARMALKMLYNCDNTITTLSEFKMRKLYVRKGKTNGLSERKCHCYGNCQNCVTCAAEGKVCGVPIAISCQYRQSEGDVKLHYYNANEMTPSVLKKWDRDVEIVANNWVRFEATEIRPAAANQLNENDEFSIVCSSVVFFCVLFVCFFFFVFLLFYSGIH